MPAEFMMNCNRAGSLGEKFCLETFGIVEDESWEIKTSSSKNGRILVRPIQIVAGGGKKFYVVVRYHRLRRTLKRGPRRGQAVFNESIQDAFKRKIEVFAVRGFDLFKLVVKNGLPLRMTKVENDAEWAFYWYVPISLLPSDVLFSAESFVVYGSLYDPPSFVESLSEEIPF